MIIVVEFDELLASVYIYKVTEKIQTHDFTLFPVWFDIKRIQIVAKIISPRLLAMQNAFNMVTYYSFPKLNSLVHSVILTPWNDRIIWVSLDVNKQKYNLERGSSNSFIKSYCLNIFWKIK